MSAIGRVGASPVMFDDPMMAAQQLAIEGARDDRAIARAERDGARQERETHMERSLSEERAAAGARLASALVGAGSKITSGAMGIASAAVSRQATVAEANTSASESHHAPGSSVVDVGGRVEAANLRQAAASIDASGKIIDGCASATSGGLDFLSEQHRVSSKQAEKQADRARERAEDAQSRGQEAGDVASRMMNRMEDIARAQRQAEDQRIANIRG